MQVYPVASPNTADFHNLVNVYLDAVLRCVPFIRAEGNLQEDSIERRMYLQCTTHSCAWLSFTRYPCSVVPFLCRLQASHSRMDAGAGGMALGGRGQR